MKIIEGETVPGRARDEENGENEDGQTINLSPLVTLNEEAVAWGCGVGLIGGSVSKA